ncbi:MAG: response regulator, partial [Planctomycetaceae bacterium]|nr:response regulator [Planctomycetaceae bacterium]
GTVMCHAVETIQVAVDAGGHQLIFSPPAEPVTVIGDSTRLVQVFGNLLHNACKYTGTRGLIHFHAARHAEHVVVTVKDNGPGISAEMLSKIFHMFCQADQTLERSHGGLGIGLSLAEQLVRLHGGDIQAHSEGLGCGAEFVVTLPIAAARTSKHSAAPSQSQPALDVGLSKRRILVVDDWEEVAETLAAMLRVMGQEVMTLNDGRQVVDWIKSHPLDVAILDIAMPEMNGYEIARAIRRLPELNHVVLVAVTGFGQKRDRRRALQSGFDRQLTKPVDLPTLHALLRDLPHEPLAAPRAAGLAGTRSS